MELPKNMLQQIQQMQDALIEAQQALSEETVSGTAGLPGVGAVTITVTGDQRCTQITIDPPLLASGDAEMLQDLVRTALNTALESSRALALERLGPLSGGMNV